MVGSFQTGEEYYGELGEKQLQISSHCLHCWEGMIVLTLLCWQIGLE